MNRARAAVEATILAIASALCILLAPLPPEFQRPLICADVRFIGARAHILANCDAESFVELARSPEGVLGTSSPRQTRPGYAVLGSVMSLPFRALPASLGDPYYAGYVMLNILLMIGAAMLLSDLLGARSLTAPAMVVPASILFFNHITKAFLWTPHQQILGLFASMLSIAAARQMIRRREPIRPAAALAGGLATGLACLAYGAFILVPASAIIAGWLYRRESSATKLVLTLVLAAGTVLPLIAWRQFVLARTGSFYSHETQYYHEFVWIFERLRQGGLWQALVHNLALFAGTFPRALALPFAFLGAAAALAASRARIGREQIEDSAFKASVAFLIAAIPFYAFMGFYDPRLTAALIPGLVVLTGALTKVPLSSESPGQHPALPEPVSLAAIGYILIVMMIPGPYA